MNYEYQRQSVNSDKLLNEIRNSSISIAVENIVIDQDEIVGFYINIFFKAQLSQAEILVLNDIITNHDSTPTINPNPKIDFNINNLDNKGNLKVAPYEIEGDSATIVSHNWADKCSWYQGSVEIILGELTPEAQSQTVFKYQDKTHWIDLTHGRLYDEDNIMLKTNNKYLPKIYIDDVLIPENQYQIDYELGKVTFFNNVSGVVKASFHYADKSWFIIKPNAGKILSIKNSEIQFSTNLDLVNPFVFETWFTDPLDGILKPVPFRAIYYKTPSDFISASNEGTLVNKFGGLLNDVIILPFKYARIKPLYSSHGTEIRVYIKNHVPVNVEMTTATFYVIIDQEA